MKLVNSNGTYRQSATFNFANQKFRWCCLKIGALWLTTTVVPHHCARKLRA